MVRRTLLPLAVVSTLAAAVVGVSSAGAVGTACTASSVVLSAPDRATFNWTLPVTWATNGSARILVRPTGSTAAFTSLTTVSGVRTAGDRATLVSIPSLAPGSWDWRIEVRPPARSGVVDYCDATSAVVVARPPAPAVAVAGAAITSDGWRAVSPGQSVAVAPAAGNAVGDPAYVRFQLASGAWSSEATAPAAIPTSDVVAVQGYHRSASGLTGAVTTMALRTDVTPPTAPAVQASRVTVGPLGTSVDVGAAFDSQSGVSRYEWSIASAAGVSTPWATVTGMRVSITAADIGGVLYLRSCDAVGNCSAPVALRIQAASADCPNPPAGRGSNSTPPRITALTPQAPAGGAGRVAVTMSRPAEVSFTVTSGARTVASVRAWLGEGMTRVRIPGSRRAVRGATLTARPTAGAVSGDAVTAVFNLPAATRRARKAETSVPVRTPIRSDGVAMLYDVDAAVREVVSPSDGAAGLTGGLGARRQEPSTSGLFATDDAQWMVGKVKLAAIIHLPTDQMVDIIRRAIDASPSHTIGIDEVTTTAADPPAPNVKGARAPAGDPQSPGGQFAAALAALDTPSPYGGTWASRINVYLAPAMTSALAAGRGPDRNLGRDGRPHFRTYRTVLSGLSHVGAVWIEMYHGLGATITSPFTVAEWRTAPAAVAAEFRRAGGDVTRLHMLVTGSDGFPAGGPLPAGCVTPHSCAWALAEATPAGRQILANGVGGYRLASSARAFLAEWHARR